MKPKFTFPKILAGFVFLIHSSSFLVAQERIPEFKATTIDIDNPLLRTKFLHAVNVHLETAPIAGYIHGKSSSSFRLTLAHQKSWELTIQPSQITSSNYALKIQTREGLQAINSHPDFLFKGTVKGSNTGEQVRLAIKEGFIYGVISSENKEYFIEPLNRFISPAQKDEYVVYEANDVIGDKSFSCGVPDGDVSINQTDQNSLNDQRSQAGICKKIKFISVADFSMYQKFGKDIYAVETSLLANLNLAQAAFTALNLGPDGSTDIGSDQLQFEMEEIVVSTCKECDLAQGTENVSTIGNYLWSWAAKNTNDPAGKIIQYWTTNPFFDITGRGLVGTISNLATCNGIAGEVLRYTTDDPAFLRVLIAHETGHALGCPHDNDIKSDVTGFIMYSAANSNCKRFSTLADFGGLNFSSQQTMRNAVLTNASCLEDCGSNSCAEVRDLKIDYQNFDNAIQITWTGSGNYLAKYKISDSNFYDPNNIRQTDLNSISLKDLEPCTLYKFEIQRNCGASYSRSSSILFKTSSLNVTTKPLNIHGDKYDLEVNMDCKKCSDEDYFIKIDGKPYNVSNSKSLTQIVFKDLFADGARHRVDVRKDSGNSVCSAASYYTAPYYRFASTKLLTADFNDCTIATGWKDSLLAKHNTTSPDAHWIISRENFFTTRTARGSLDSTCMIYYSSFNTLGNPYSGSVSLTSPKLDITGYKDIMLHFDYNFLAYQYSNFPTAGSIKVEVFDGIAWQKVEERLPNERIGGLVRNIWDSLPPRDFIDLDKYKNKDFQVRFIVDDGSLNDNRSLSVFAAFDNIQIDAYPEAAITNDFSIYPNPAREELFIQFTQAPLSNIKYALFDLNGRVMQNGTLNNYRLSLKHLGSGMYFIRLYQNDRLIGSTKKIVRL